MGYHVKGRSPKTLESSIELPNIFNVKVHVLSFNIILNYSPARVLDPSYPFLGKFGVKVKCRSTKKRKILEAVP